MSTFIQVISAVMKEHLLRLESTLKEYFPSIHSNKVWIRNQFTVIVVSQTELPDWRIGYINELPYDTVLRNKFDIKPMMGFWLSCRQKYPILSKKTDGVFNAFVMTYKYDFQQWLSKKIYWLQVEMNLKVNLTYFSLNPQFLVNKQLLPSINKIFCFNLILLNIWKS